MKPEIFTQGQFCEECSPGYTRKPSNGGPFVSCVPCECHGHSLTPDQCEPESGACDCSHNTMGNQCQFCADGYFGHALNGLPGEIFFCNDRYDIGATTKKMREKSVLLEVSWVKKKALSILMNKVYYFHKIDATLTSWSNLFLKYIVFQKKISF